MTVDLRALEINAWLARAELLAQLQSLPAWSAWTALLIEMRAGALERCADPDEKQLGYWQGVAGAIGEILERPVRITTDAADYQRAEEDEKKVIRPELRAAIGLGVDTDGAF